jgi:CubicO group peptidase (beta-lactamase class C family)
MANLDNYDQYIEAAMQSWHCPGVAISIVKGDDLLHQGVYGLRDVEENLPMTVDTRFAMASVTKSFTAMTVAQLVDDGKLEWDKPVREYMPEFILHDNYITQNITVRDMLSHRTGLPRHDFAAWRMQLSRAEFIKRMKNFKFSATFRERFQYNNLMYYATAYLAEKVSDQKWEDVVQERIFDPLGMNASNFLPEAPQNEQITAWGYRVDRDEAGASKGLIRMPFGDHTELSPSSAGALFSTLADLTQWLKVHVNDGQVGDTKIVSPNNLKQMHLPQTIIPGGGISEALHGNTIFTYGMGWFIEPYRGNTLVQHGGNVEGFSLIIGFIPQEKIGIVALTNIAGLPLRDILLYESIDRALNLPDKDWNSRYHKIFDPIIIAQAKGKQTAASEKLEDAAPTHPLETYVGTYAAEGYPDFGVRLEGDELQACTIGSLEWSSLRHYHYNVFEWHLTDFDSWIKIRFLVNDSGEVNAISIPIEPAVENATFTRKPIELPDDIIASLIGEYETDVDGFALTITSHDGKIYATNSGGTPDEIEAYKLDETVIGLNQNRTRLEFKRENGVIVALSVKMPGLTIEGRPKAK